MVLFEISGSKYVMFETHQHYFRNINNLSIKVGMRANRRCVSYKWEVDREMGKGCLQMETLE